MCRWWFRIRERACRSLCLTLEFFSLAAFREDLWRVRLDLSLTCLLKVNKVRVYSRAGSKEVGGREINQRQGLMAELGSWNLRLLRWVNRGLAVPSPLTLTAIHTCLWRKTTSWAHSREGVHLCISGWSWLCKTAVLLMLVLFSC